MREFLKGLELDEETIDTIMAEYGKNITKFKEENDDLKAKVSDYEAKVEELNGTITANSESLKNLENLTNENKNLKADIKLNGTNVKKEFSKFVRSEVMSRVDDKTDFEKALDSYKKENPQYFGETVVTKMQTSPTLSGGAQPQSTNSIMNDILRGAVNKD